jgi:putative ATPase
VLKEANDGYKWLVDYHNRTEKIADPEALPLAISTQQAVEFVGLPEARIPLAHATAYMCRAKKSREAYEALGTATQQIEAERTRRVPEKLKNKRFPVNPER